MLTDLEHPVTLRYIFFRNPNSLFLMLVNRVNNDCRLSVTLTTKSAMRAFINILIGNNTGFHMSVNLIYMFFWRYSAKKIYKDMWNELLMIKNGLYTTGLRTLHHQLYKYINCVLSEFCILFIKMILLESFQLFATIIFKT